MKQKFLISLFAYIFLFGVFNQVYAQINDLRIISKNNDGVLGNNVSANAFVSEDGNFVTFMSGASNLVLNDNNAVYDVFVYDIVNNTVERVSVDDQGNEGDGGSTNPVISEDGRYVVFESEATNLVDNDTNGEKDIFLYDRTLDSVELISLAEGGGASNGISENPHISLDARYIGFNTYATNIDSEASTGIFVYDRNTDTMERITVNSNEELANNDSSSFGLSNDGRYVVFQSGATNLSSGDDNLSDDVFVRDRTLGTTEIVSVSSSEILGDIGGYLNVQRNSITEDGRYVLFGSSSTNLVDDDTNNENDVFVRDRTSGVTTRINVSSSGDEANGDSGPGSISPDGRYLIFRSEADNLVSGDDTYTQDSYDVFVKDLSLGTIKRITVSVDEESANNTSEDVPGGFSGGGRFIVYSSAATNLTEDLLDPGSYHIFYAEIKDDDGIASSIEDAAPNSGDVDENGYDDAIEENITPFVNSVSGNYSTIKTTGDCFSNSNPSAVAEGSLATADAGYDYPLGIISFEVNCVNAGETATVSVYCFCENTPVDGTIARKYNENTGEYTTIDSAVIEEVTIDGQRALKMTYDVVDGGELDEDGLSNGTIVDPVGFARVAAADSSGGGSSSSSGSRPKAKVAVAENIFPTQLSDNKVCNVFTTLMKKGSRFGEVSKLQTVLSALGFNPGIADGIFGPLTDASVKAFQKSKNLDIDGIVGPMTRSALNNCNN